LACAELRLPAAYVPHSLRHGGATRLKMRGVPLEEVMQRGRWAVSPSARHYIQAGEAMLLSVAVPRAVAERARELAADPLLSVALHLSSLASSQ